MWSVRKLSSWGWGQGWWKPTISKDIRCKCLLSSQGFLTYSSGTPKTESEDNATRSPYSNKRVFKKAWEWAGRNLGTSWYKDQVCRAWRLDDFKATVAKNEWPYLFLPFCLAHNNGWLRCWNILLLLSLHFKVGCFQLLSTGNLLVYSSRSPWRWRRTTLENNQVLHQVNRLLGVCCILALYNLRNL